MFEWVHYQFPTRVFAERDSTHKIGTLVRDIGTRILLISIREELSNPDELAVIKTSLEKHTAGCIVYDDIEGTPTAEDLDTAAHFVKQCKADIIMGYGLRESFHAAKAIALLATNEIFATELPQATMPLKKPPLPVVCVPTGPAMGEESTPMFSVYIPEQRNTFTSSDPRLFPALIFVDPNISLSLTSNEITRGGVAVMSAAVETMLSKKANDITTAVALRSLELITKNLVSLVTDLNNHSARMNVAMASLLCGMAHSNSLLGLCYSIATVTFNLTGLDFYMAMSILLPHVMEYNLTTSAGKYVQIARALDEDIADITVIEAAIKAVEGVRKIYLELKVPQRLSDFEIKKSDLPEIAEAAYKMPLTRNTPREMDRNEIETVLIAAF